MKDQIRVRLQRDEYGDWCGSHKPWGRFWFCGEGLSEFFETHNASGVLLLVFTKQRTSDDEYQFKPTECGVSVGTAHGKFKATLAWNAWRLFGHAYDNGYEWVSIELP